MRWAERAMQHWYRPSFTLLTAGLLPLSWIFGGIVRGRRRLYRAGWLKKTVFPVPVIVVGNLTVGGTGKTPVVIWLAKSLRELGYRPGIVARGVGGRGQTGVCRVTPDSDPQVVGDEAVLLARRSDCPLVIAKDRVQAVQALLDETDCNIVISDDGLQHYRLGRSFEIILMDGIRALGNGALLPAGPLREPAARLSEAHAVFVKGRDFTLTGETLISAKNRDRHQPLADFEGRTVHAVAAIGHPEKFFADLRAKGLNVIPHAFPDHCFFERSDIFFGDSLPVIMTEKDAVKCHAFAGNQHWYLPVEVCPNGKMKKMVDSQTW